MIAPPASANTPLLEDLWAFTKTETVLVAFELGLFKALIATPLPIEGLANQVQIEPVALTRLLNLLQTWGYVTLQANQTVSATQQTTHLFSSPEKQASWHAYATYIRQVQAAWGGLPSTIQQGTPTGSAFSLNEAEARFSNLNEGLLQLHAPLADALFTALLPYLPSHETNPTCHWLDVGAGSGVWSIPFLKAFPQGTVTFLDYPSILAQAEASTALAPFKNRMRLIACDFESTSVEWQPETIADATVVIMGNVLRELSHEGRVNLLKKAWHQLTEAGVLVIVETLTDAKSTTVPLASTVADLHLLATSFNSTGCLTKASLTALCQSVLGATSGGIDLTWLTIDAMKQQGLAGVVIKKSIELG
ncbi:MAG: methyltransferase [Candidatus Melainabacteria bacterium]|nr:methyltransferase [Candidatus Melainabacteria bacterium]